MLNKPVILLRTHIPPLKNIEYLRISIMQLEDIHFCKTFISKTSVNKSAYIMYLSELCTSEMPYLRGFKSNQIYQRLNQVHRSLQVRLPQN